MESVKIVLLCIASAAMYGVLHDQATARVCVEYFTIGHPPVFNTESPTLLALGWGVIATWWVGLLLGVPGVLVSRIGSWPRYDDGMRLPRCGVRWVLRGESRVWLVEPLRSEVPEAKHVAFLADLWAHLAAYGVGFLGGIALCGWVLFQRSRMAGAASSTN